MTQSDGKSGSPHRRPERAAAVLLYIAMSLLYKKSNWLWPFLIRHRLTGPVWRPLVEASRLRHIFYRSRLDSMSFRDEDGDGKGFDQAFQT